MPRTVLITGITGFAGSHLAERFAGMGIAVHGLAHEEPPYRHLAALGDRVQIHRGDIGDLAALRAALERARPDVVVHLAGQAVPALAARDPIAAVRVNVMGTATVITALDDRSGVRLVAASSAHVYGAPDAVPVDESAARRPGNVYAATKLAAEALLREFGARGTNPVTILRPANQLGPRLHPGLAASAFAKQIAEAEAGVADAVIRHGALDARRDFLDVRDMAEAYALASDIADVGATTYNVGTGTAVSIAELLDILLDLARVPVRTEFDPLRGQSGDTSAVALDARRFRKRTGWAPHRDLRGSLRDTLDYWRAQVVHGVTA